MSVYKTIEVMGASKKSWEDAVEQVVAEASKSVKGITSVWVKDMSAEVEGAKITNHKVNCKVTFEVK